MWIPHASYINHIYCEENLQNSYTIKSLLNSYKWTSNCGDDISQNKIDFSVSFFYLFPNPIIRFSLNLPVFFYIKSSCNDEVPYFSIIAIEISTGKQEVLYFFIIWICWNFLKHFSNSHLGLQTLWVSFIKIFNYFWMSAVPSPIPYHFPYLETLIIRHYSLSIYFNLKKYIYQKWSS